MKHYVLDNDLSDFARLVMKHVKRRKRDVLEAIRRLPGFKKEFILNDSAGVFHTHANEWAEGWAQSDLADGRPPKPLYGIVVPYGNTPSLMLFTQCPKEALEKEFPEAIVRFAMES